MVTVRAASGDGASMHAQSPLDLVAQLSLQVLFRLPCCALPYIALPVFVLPLPAGARYIQQFCVLILLY